ncbi:MAG: biosynthetic-type acetolactate synthase large subunit [Dehalococcoidia bacterium]|nr:biosynthetic-type acetolactate synthase large subunit [Dehalococcoidia bacterium]MDD5494854.1 biosynthetic-type acetolactate synthase large subunit [Dehalococcoidia bacterium]
MMKTGAEILCECLLKEGVEVVFGFPGGVLLPLYDTFPKYPELRHILVRHEQGAAHAADAYARVTGKIGVCLATSGPGATNLVTGIANAYLDSAPMLAITGQVPTFFIGKDAFQEVDITGVTIPITKYNHLVLDAAELAEYIREAIYVAQSGRPGPVLLDIPRDVLQTKTDFVFPEKVDLPGYKPKLFGHPAQIKKASDLINTVERPVIIAGRGVNVSRAFAELKELAEKSQIPVVTTFLGIGCFPESHVLSYGWLGMHGMGYANKAIHHSDLVVAIGMRFDDRATGVVSAFAPQARIIHIDIDAAEIGKNLNADVPIVGDIKNVLQVLNKQITKREHVSWLSQLDEWRAIHPATEVRDHEGLLPQYIIRQIHEVTKGDTIIVTDVGQHQMWAGQYFFYDKPNSFVSSGGLGTMGFGLPASIGAKVGAPHETVWCICGDGGFQMTVQELATMVQENLDINIAVMNNGWLGMVRQWQELIYEKRYFGTQLYNPDFVKIAEAYGIKGVKVNKKIDVRPAIEKAMAHKGPFLIEFVVEPEENVYPFVPPGKTLVEFLEMPSPSGSLKK